jgi:hypothetical protein
MAVPRTSHSSADFFSRIRARMEIQQLTTTYAWAIDSKDIDALGNCP